ncbi:MAG TPA: histidine kinase [Chitinophagaceae bacterium]|nr:histidine kinase [Chitinophagaceae bacterium]
MVKKLPYLLLWVLGYTASSQSFPIRNSNLEYVVTNLYDPDILKDDLHEIVRDNKGLYWFQSSTGVYSFDGVNWRAHRLGGSGIPPRINDIEVTGDGNTWLATSDGIFLFDAAREYFVPAEELYPSLKGMSIATSCFTQGIPGHLIITSMQREGFFLLDWKKKTTRHIVIDPFKKAFISSNGFPIVTDDSLNIWGTTADNRGIWNYNFQTGTIRCSWKAELPQFAHPRFTRYISLAYEAPAKSIWVSHLERKYIEKINLQTNSSQFYSFTGNLQVTTDTGLKNKLPVLFVKIDRDNNAWLRLASKYLVKINEDIRKWEYICNDRDLLPLGEWRWFKPETKTDPAKTTDNHISLWLLANDRLSLVKKRTDIVRHIPFDSNAVAGIRPADYDNTDGRMSMFFENGKNGNYLMFQQNAGRPKIINFNKDLQITQALFNDQWKNYPAYFRSDYNPDSFFIAFMRPGSEPLDFRNIVIREFRVNLQTFQKEEIKLDFPRRVWRYGNPDASGIHWLFSNGYLYSYDPAIKKLDSIYICLPAEKGSFNIELIKGYDYPAVLHKNSYTYWIAFIPTKELYKINLRTRKIEKIFKTCSNPAQCQVPASIFDMYNFDAERIYLQSSYSSMLINARTDSITTYLDLFPYKLSFQQQNGSGLYKDWMIVVMPDDIYFLNTHTRKQKRMRRNEDYKWVLSQFNSRPLVNDKGEMILMSSQHKGFLRFSIDSVLQAARPGNVGFSYFKLDNRNLPLDSLLKDGVLKLHYNDYNTMQLGFSDHSVFDPEKIGFEYALYKGGDTTWNRIDGRPELTLGELSPGSYQLLLRAANAVGDFSPTNTSLAIRITPPFWQRSSFLFAVAVILLAGLFLYFRARINAIRKKEKEKTKSVKQMAELELQSLRSQLNPHFMFNSLNAIQELILMEENEKAHTYLARFSKLLRMMLENTEKPFVALNKELGFLELYLSLENLRVPDLQFSIRVDPGVDPASTYIPNMVLQPYIENALWHGLAHKKGNRLLDLNIYKQNGSMIYDISDNGVGRKKAAELKSLYRKEHKSKGMELLTKRFKLLSEEFGSEIKSTIRDLENNGEIAGTLVQLSIPADLGSAVIHTELSQLHVTGKHKENMAPARD